MRKILPIVLSFALACGGVAEPAPPATTSAAAPAKEPAKPAKKASGEGEIEVATAAAVTVQIDGSNVMFDPIQGAYIKRNLSVGTHTVEVFNAIGKEVAEEKVDVQANERTKFRYKNGGRMESFGSFPVD